MLELAKTYETEIAGYNHAGVPLAKIDGAAVFTNDGVVGDTVRLRISKIGRKFIFAETAEIVKPSPHRIESDCAGFSAKNSSRCGGCDFRCADYESESRFKSETLSHAFRNFKTAEFLPLVKADSISAYRNKAQYKFAKADTVRYGFYARGSHRVVSCSDNGEHGGCKLHPPIFGQIAETVRRMAGELKLSVYNEQTRQGVLRGLFVREGSDKNIAVVFCVKRNVPELKKIAGALRHEHGAMSVITNVAPATGNVVLGEKDFLLYGDGCVTEKLSWGTGQVTLSAPYRSFLQVNTVQCEKLYDIVYGFADLRGRHGGGVAHAIADLYCGIGSIGIYLAARAAAAGTDVTVRGIDEVADSVTAAEKNAAANNVHAEYKCGNASDFTQLFGGEKIDKIDIAVLDPARKGAGEKVLADIAGMLSPRKFIYVSCNPDTAARDCETLRGLGYAVKKIQGCDMFPRTRHCECVILLEKES